MDTDPTYPDAAAERALLDGLAASLSAEDRERLDDLEGTLRHRAAAPYKVNSATGDIIGPASDEFIGKLERHRRERLDHFRRTWASGPPAE